MSKFENIIHYPFKLLFCLSVLILCYKNFNELDLLAQMAEGNVFMMASRYHLEKHKELIIEFSRNLVVISNILLAMATIFHILGIELGKRLLYMSGILQIVFINNPIIDQRSNNVVIASAYMSIVAGFIALDAE